MNNKEVELVARLLEIELEGVAMALTHRVTVCIPPVWCRLCVTVWLFLSKIQISDAVLISGSLVS